MISAPSKTKEILEKYGLHAKKGYGQNFLVDPAVVARCAEESHCEGAVIEIGPGIGSLTEQLALRSEKVRAYEVDERLIPVLEDVLSDYDNVEVILQDVLEADIAESVKELKEAYGSVSVCANLPYYITTPVLFRLFECEEAIPWITVMVQKEVADRFAAPCGSSDYGILSVECACLYDVKKLFQVSRKCFVPSPNVDSAVIRFERKQEAAEIADRQAYFSFVRSCFARKRKTIFNNLKEIPQEEGKTQAVLEEAGIDPSVRPQNITPGMYVRLYDLWRRS